MKKNKKEKKPISQGEGAPQPLSKAEIEMLRAAMDAREVDRSTLPSHDNSLKAKICRFIKENKIFTAVCAVLAICVVILIVLLSVMAISSLSRNRVNKDDFTLMIGDEVLTVKYKTAMRDDILYVDMYKIAAYAELTKTGTKSNVKFTAAENQYLRFENDSEFAVINGAMVEMSGKATVNAEVCDIPLEFLMTVLGKNNGLKITLDTDTNTIKIKRRMYITEDEDAYLPVEILFYSDSFNIIQAIKRPDEEEPPQYEYLIAIDKYLSNIDPENTEEYLLLANKESILGEDYAPSDLTQLECRVASGRTMYLREDAALSLYAMMEEMNAAGITDVYVTSAYRSYIYQVGLFERYVNKHMNEGMSREEAEATALEYSARPGTSEHQTGLCLDFMTDDMSNLDESFENTAAFRWLSENAHKFGFILRYMENKVDVTGYKYEPWHYRFVGRTAAAEIYNSGLCLEEYLTLN